MSTADILGGEDGFSFSVETESVESEEQLHSGNYPTKEGYAHITCESVEASKPNDEKLRFVELKFEVRAMCGLSARATESLPDQVGKTFNSMVFIQYWEDTQKTIQRPLNEKEGTRLKALFYAFGLINEEQLKETKLVGNFGALKGRQAIGKITKGKDRKDPVKKDENGDPLIYKGRHQVQWPNDFYRIGSETVKDCLIDGAIASMGGIQVPGVDAADII